MPKITKIVISGFPANSSTNQSQRRKAARDGEEEDGLENGEWEVREWDKRNEKGDRKRGMKRGEREERNGKSLIGRVNGRGEW